MENRVAIAAQAQAQKNIRRKRRLTVVGLLSICVAFGVFYMLLLPGITMESVPTCGLEEHVHDDSCFGPILLCEEPELELICQLSETPATTSAEEESGAEAPGHVHTEDCFEYVQEYICTPDAAHTHSESCFQEVSALSCEGHEHEDGCYVIETIACTNEDPEHEHDNCDTEQRVLACESDHHDDGCYITDTVQICELDESEPAPHEHNDSCMSSQMVTICGLEEQILAPETTEQTKAEAGAHVHDESCYAVVHTHDESCYETEPGLICGLEEHQHEDLCYEAPMYGLMALTTSSTSSNLAEYLSSDDIVILDTEGKPITDGAITVGQSYQLSFTFREQFVDGIDLQFTCNELGQMTYQFPPNITFPEAQSGLLYHNGTEIPFGTYAIGTGETNGLLTVTVYEGWVVDGVWEETPGIYYYDNYVNTRLTINAAASFNIRGGTGEQEIEFGDNAIITINLVEPVAALDVSKANGAFNPETRTLDYIITLTAVGGDLTNLTLQDAISFRYSADMPGLEAPGYGDIYIEGDVVVTKPDGEQFIVTPVEVNPNGDPPPKVTSSYYALNQYSIDLT